MVDDKTKIESYKNRFKKNQILFFGSMRYQYEKPTNQKKLFLQFGIGSLRLIPVKFGLAFEK